MNKKIADQINQISLDLRLPAFRRDIKEIIDEAVKEKASYEQVILNVLQAEQQLNSEKIVSPIRRSSIACFSRIGWYMQASVRWAKTSDRIPEKDTHKVAISNHRIVQVTQSEVSFSYKDYRDGGNKKTMTLSNAEFTRRFAQHILPHRFVRIRHYGILSATWKRGKLQTLQAQLKIKRPEGKVKTLLRKCPCCKTGTLITLEIFGKRGPPKKYLL